MILNKSIIYRRLRASLLHVRKQPEPRGRGKRWRQISSRRLLIKSGVVSVLFLNLNLRCLDCSFVYIVILRFLSRMTDVIFTFIILGWVNGHWSGTRNPVRIRWWVFKAASLLTGAWSCGVKTSYRGGSSPPEGRDMWMWLCLRLWLWLWWCDWDCDCGYVMIGWFDWIEARLDSWTV